MNRRVAVLGLLWLAISGAVVFAPGCYGRNCEGEATTFGANPGEGVMIDPDTWASGPVDGPWLNYSRQRYYVFDVRALGGRTPQLILPYVSASPDPIETGGDFTLGSGNLAKLLHPGPNRVDVYNDSCSDYFLRLVIKVQPFPPVPDAGLSDASRDDSDADNADSGVADPTDPNDNDVVDAGEDQ